MGTTVISYQQSACHLTHSNPIHQPQNQDNNICHSSSLSSHSDYNIKHDSRSWLGLLLEGRLEESKPVEGHQMQSVMHKAGNDDGMSGI